MKVAVLHDAFSILRARLEADQHRFSISNLLHEIDASPHAEFWVFDGPGNIKTRQAIFPDYKAKRKPARVDIFQGLQFVKEMMKHTKALVIEVPGYEADDVIATLVGKMRGRTPVVINTRDRDLRALCSEEFNVRCTIEQKNEIPDHLLQLFKLWTGDASDNIPGVHLFGLGAWKNARLDEIVQLTAAVLNDDPLPKVDTVPKRCLNWLEDNRDRFKAMKQCISFQDVPGELISKHTVVGRSDLETRMKMLEEFA